MATKTEMSEKSGDLSGKILFYGLMAAMAGVFISTAMFMFHNIEPPANSTLLRIASLDQATLDFVDASEAFADAFGSSATVLLAKEIKDTNAQPDLDDVSLMCVQDAAGSDPRAFYYSYDVKPNFGGMKVYEASMTEMNLDLQGHGPLRNFCTGVLP